MKHLLLFLIFFLLNCSNPTNREDSVKFIGKWDQKNTQYTLGYFEMFQDSIFQIGVNMDTVLRAQPYSHDDSIEIFFNYRYSEKWDSIQSIYRYFESCIDVQCIDTVKTITNRVVFTPDSIQTIKIINGIEYISKKNPYFYNEDSLIIQSEFEGFLHLESSTYMFLNNDTMVTNLINLSLQPDKLDTLIRRF